MRITIDPTTADCLEEHNWLDRILHRIDDGWHVWDITDASAIDALKATSWISGRGQHGWSTGELLEKSIVGTVWRSKLHGRYLRVTRTPTSDDELRPQEALRFVDEPIVILVENRNSDGSFVRRIVAETDSSLNKLWQRPGRSIRLDSVGGAGEIPNEIARRVDEVPYRPRLIAITDSGRKSPEDDESVDAKRVRTACTKYGVSCWVLAKREAENYLPRVLLDERPDAGAQNSLTVETWSRLSDDQKDFFNMKSGLSADNTESSRRLFADLSPTAQRILAAGFGPQVHKCWEIWKVQAKEQVLARGQGELERGTELIRSEV